MTEWPDDQMTKWPIDQMTIWLDDHMTGWQDDRMTGWPDDWMTRWPDDWMTRWWDEQMTGWPIDLMTGWREASQTIDRIVYLYWKGTQRAVVLLYSENGLDFLKEYFYKYISIWFAEWAMLYFTWCFWPERSVTPQRCLPLNPLVLSEQAQGWCWDVFSLSKSTGNTDAPTSRLSSFFFNLLLLSTDTSSNILNRTFLTDGHILNQIYTHLFISSSDIVSNRFLKFLIPFLKLLS